MPYAEAKVRASSWKAEDYSTRLAELRSEWAEVSEKDRNSDEYKASKKSLFEEREALDFEYRIVRQQEGSFLPGEIEMQRRNGGVGLMSPEAQHEYRSAGELVVSDEEIATWLKRPSGK